MAVAHAHEREPAELAASNRVAQPVRRRVEALGKALHEEHAAVLDRSHDALAIGEARAQRLFAQDGEPRDATPHRRGRAWRDVSLQIATAVHWSSKPSSDA